MSGVIRLNGSTSGFSELQAPDVAGDQIFMLPETGGTLATIVSDNFTPTVSGLGAGMTLAGKYVVVGNMKTVYVRLQAVSGVNFVVPAKITIEDLPVDMGGAVSPVYFGSSNVFDDDFSGTGLSLFSGKCSGTQINLNNDGITISGSFTKQLAVIATSLL